MIELTEGQQAIMDAVDERGYVKVFTDYKSGRRHVTNGAGKTFDARSFDSLVRKGLIHPSPEPNYGPTSIEGIKWERVMDDPAGEEE